VSKYRSDEFCITVTTDVLLNSTGAALCAV